jgi:hypothetical protein
MVLRLQTGARNPGCLMTFKCYSREGGPDIRALRPHDPDATQHAEAIRARRKRNFEKRSCGSASDLCRGCGRVPAAERRPHAACDRMPAPAGLQSHPPCDPLPRSGIWRSGPLPAARLIPTTFSTTLSGNGLACNDSCRSDRGCKRCKPVMTAAPQQLSPPWLLPFGVAPRPGAFVVPYSGAFACERKGPVAR